MIFRILLLAEITYNLISNVKCNHKGGFEVNIWLYTSLLLYFYGYLINVCSLVLTSCILCELVHFIYKTNDEGLTLKWIALVAYTWVGILVNGC